MLENMASRWIAHRPTGITCNENAPIATHKADRLYFDFQFYERSGTSHGSAHWYGLISEIGKHPFRLTEVVH